MTRIVNALERQGLITKKKSLEDGRSTRLSATAAGKKLLFEGRKRRVRALARQIDRLPREKRMALHAAAQILQEVVRRI